MKKDKILIIAIVIILNLVITAISLFQQEISLILILPYSYLIGLILISFKNQTWNKSLSKILIIFLFGIRMVIYPFFCIINNNTEQLKEYLTLNDAILIQIYEYFVIILFLMHMKPEKTKDIDCNIIDGEKRTTWLNFAIILLFIISAIFILIYPQTLNIFKLPFFTSDEAEVEWMRTSANIKNTMPTAIYYLGIWLIKLTRIILIYFFITGIKRLKVKKEKSSVYIKILTSIALACIPAIITTDDRASGFLATFVLLLLIARIYKEKRKQIITIAISLIVAIATIVLLILPTIKQGNTIKNNDYDTRINAYFSGTINIAAGLNMPTVNSYQYAKGDILRYIPLVVSFYVDNPQSNDLFNQVLGVDTIYNSQIMPTIIQGYFYFGYILSPVFSLILAYFAVKTEEKANKAKEMFGYFIYMYMLVFFAIGIIMYYFSLTIYLFLQYVFPMLCMYKILKRQGEKV